VEWSRVPARSRLNAAIAVARANCGGPQPARPRSEAAVVPVVAAPPAAGGTFDLRLRGAAAQNARPSTIYVTSDKGGVAGPFTVG
jgi:hypothetical protein